MQKNLGLVLSWVLYMLVLAIVWYLRLQSVMTVGIAGLGSLIGFLLPILLDVLLPKMMDGSATTSSAFAKDVLAQSAASLRAGNLHTASAPQTPLRSYPLLAAYMAAAFFVISSTQNWFGRGFVIGLGLSLVLDIFLSRNPEILRERWFSVFRTNLSDRELSYFVWAVIAIFGLLTLFSAFSV
jgi:hypothetical protein